MKKNNQSSGTGAAIFIVILVFGVIILFFGTHTGNGKDESIMNCLMDGGAIESCFNQ